MKRYLFLALVGVVCYLLSLSVQRTGPVVSSLVVKQPEPPRPTLITDTRTISGKLVTLVSSSLVFTQHVDKKQYEVKISPKTYFVWTDVDKKERIPMTPAEAEAFVKTRQRCWVLVGVHKGVASDIILNPGMDVDEFPDGK
jgi:hypothetical protein